VGVSPGAVCVCQVVVVWLVVRSVRESITRQYGPRIVCGLPINTFHMPCAWCSSICVHVSNSFLC
jgi:hypothetical protein